MKVSKGILCMLCLLGCGDNPQDALPGDESSRLVDTQDCEVHRSSTWGGVLVCPREGGFYCERDEEVSSEVE